MNVLVLSDLHLESNLPAGTPWHIEPGDADLVVLAGDIDNHARGIVWAAQAFPASVPVVYVPGNHEYYDGEFATLEAAMRTAADATPQVRYLNDGVLIDPQRRWRVLGTTLWTDFALFGAAPDALQAAMTAAGEALLDYNGPIRVAGDADAADGSPTRRFTPADSLALHHRNRAWLAHALAEPFDGTTIVVTHHAPHPLSLAPRFAQMLSSAGFISDLSPMLGPSVALWIHGHTHTSFDYTVGGTRVLCNPRGYVHPRTGQRENPAFDWRKIVTL